jgi:hypothetical protein
MRAERRARRVRLDEEALQDAGALAEDAGALAEAVV